MPRGHYRKPFIKPSKHRLNNQITASEVRIIDENGKQIGVMPLSDALRKSRELGLDLVEIAPKAKPPVVKIVDYNKFQYQETKKLNQQKKATKKSDLKEVRFKLYMDDADYQVKLKKINRFLNQNHQIKITIPFRGRQLAHKNLGFDLVNKILTDLGDKIKISRPAKFIGRKIITTISPN